MLNKEFIKELRIESEIIDSFHSLSLSGKQVIATLVLDELEKENICPASFVASYITNKKEIEKERREKEFIEL